MMKRPTIKEKCNEEYHVRIANLYCLDCHSNLCNNCITLNHRGHEIFDIEDIYTNTLENSKEFHEKITKKLNTEIKKKEYIEESFNNQVKTPYENNIQTIQKYFSKLHDTLHFKEVEIKRELKSYHDDNHDRYTSLLSNIDINIQQYNQFLDKYKDINGCTSNNNNNNDDNNNDADNNNEDNNYKNMNEVIQDHNKISVITNDIDKNIHYTKIRVEPSETNLENIMELSNLGNQENRFIYLIPEPGILEIVDIISRTSKYLDLPPNYTDHLRFNHQSIVIQEHRYHFKKGICYIQDLEEYTEFQKAVPLPEDLEGFSTVYNASEYSIYIFGGFIGNEFSNNIYIFNIITYEMRNLNVILPLTVSDQDLYLDKNNENIYMIGGMGKSCLSHVVYSFNIKSKKISSIFDTGHYYGILHGYYESESECFYLLLIKGTTTTLKVTDNTIVLMKYSLRSLSFKNLKSPPSFPSTFKSFKIYFTSTENTLSIIHPEHKNILYKYDIDKDEWGIHSIQRSKIVQI